MGDANHDMQQLSRETFRLNTYDRNILSDVKGQLARAGFFYTRNELKVKCFVCYYELDASEIDSSVDVILLHKEKRPECRFAKKLASGLDVSSRSKKFLSYDSLRYEKERLETFIEWPIPWLSPDDLAADGFYYLRTNDHCACVFCRGIVGAWEVGDTPRGEHQRHFPHCPFIRGQPVGNVSLQHSTILDKLPLDGEEFPLPPPRCEYTIDEAGAGAEVTATSGRHMPGSYAECKGPAKKETVNYSDIGLRQYTGPKRKDYITKESRVKSFSRWPERVVQKPEEMAEAGFFYCGLSDHVRCFHCGSGLRNWEIEDKPWEEHARWYPDCNFLLLSKGQEFIDKVRRERPPFLRSAATKDSKPQQVSASSGQFKSINDEDLGPLMEHDIIQAVKSMGFPLATIRKALRQKLEQTGMPFFSLEPCIETVLQVMEEETRQTLRGSNDAEVEDEAMTRQSDKMKALNIESHTSSTSTAPAPSTSVSTAAGPSQVGAGSLPSTTATSQAVVSSAEQQSAAVAVATPSASTASLPSEVLPSRSSAQPTTPETAVVASPSQGANTQAEDMDVDDEPNEAMETQAAEGATPVQSNSSPAANLTGSVVAMQEADERLSFADEALKPSRPGPPSLVDKSEQRNVAEASDDSKTPSNVEKSSVTTMQSSQKDIVEELERIRESRTCKICMDAEMSVVFLPCTHMATCSSCAVTMAQCPICRHDIKYTIKPIFS